MLKSFKLILLSLLFFCNANSEILKVFDFTEEELKTLEVRKIKGETLWSVGSNQNGNFLKAEANGVASGLGKEINIDLNKTPFLNITWKVEKDLKGIIENSKKGHDYAARVFVIKKTGATPLSNRALNYVFSSNNDIDQNWFSPYTKKSVDYILSTTKKNYNEWVSVKVNIKDHFKKFHNLDVDNLDGIALMTDTDNSELLAISYYQNIFFSSN
ncbi:MAG: DUF3047 domain-containing protein [Proteobacteria bacterium]|jgi:hypothetical protein|nr:DUF3047 domain-containing protein [Pseudomonadota bacterium]NCW36710.1 DUF3047 domain-containing protein [Pseudomonadota bacterium]NCX65528.1 DUF3047 domain-containing protein [Pseudomonadota bacterium]